ncbi:hypothetical protein MF672_047415 [Actinomadura sp. ATCC 31491]|uniref:Uncharacterized protein n=1 Tax=Actinomadura luzonensis TaxID=2805427 RepID=A0ABT0GA77_9ACTN|nr:hypothetical protein [Actinomadura luzonensis]MCK2221384.1 hypothetical protein [Actinomadura luzonensis]
MSGPSTDADAQLPWRQLAVLRSTYPAWEIDYLADPPVPDPWTATLRRPVAERSSARGVRRRLDAPDAVTLASALAHQATLLHNQRLELWPG